VSRTHETDLEARPAEVAARIAAVAEDWGGEWNAGSDGGRLTLPVVFGLRRGLVEVEVELTRLGEGRTRLVWRTAESRLAVERSSVAVLSIAAVPLVVTIVWPFYPALFPLVPVAAIFGLIAWWLVVSRLRSHGPEEFFTQLAEAPPAGESEPPVVR